MLAYEELLSPLLLRRFELEALAEDGNGQYYACILRQDGDLVVHHPLGPPLDVVQLMWARDLLALLNRELHHDGAWVIVFTHPQPPSIEQVAAATAHRSYARYALIWLDADGDPQFTQEWQQNITSDLRDFACVVEQGLEAVAAKAEACWRLWHLCMREVIDPTPDQLFKRAKGERPPSESGK